MRRRTLIGAAEVIRALMEVRCGGAAERGARTNQGVSFRSMRAKKTMMKKMMIMIKKKIKLNNLSIQDVNAVKKWAILSKIVLVTRISKQSKTQRLNSTESIK